MEVVMLGRSNGGEGGGDPDRPWNWAPKSRVSISANIGDRDLHD